MRSQRDGKWKTSNRDFYDFTMKHQHLSRGKIFLKTSSKQILHLANRREGIHSNGFRMITRGGIWKANCLFLLGKKKSDYSWHCDLLDDITTEFLWAYLGLRTSESGLKFLLNDYKTNKNQTSKQNACYIILEVHWLICFYLTVYQPIMDSLKPKHISDFMRLLILYDVPTRSLA